MPELVLGPILRHAGETDATVWVETDGPCRVEFLGCSSRTFRVGTHHYALVRATGLAPGTVHGYGIGLDGEKVWPEPDSPFPPSVVRTTGDGRVKLVFGSCRISAPHEAPYTLDHTEDPRGLGVDALYATAMRLKDEPAEELPDALLLLGDQIYAHKPPFDTLDFVRSRRDTGKAPGETVANFGEYARLYKDTWGDPAIRWLLSTVPSAMVFDDHEVDDDWNISASWLEEARHQPHWNDLIAGAHVSYLVYQHLGNLAPNELEDDDLYGEILASDDARPLLENEARRAHRDSTVARWSYWRDLGNARLLVVDSRGGRVLEENRRAMVDADEWAWIEEKATGSFDHLLLATSLPLLLGPAMHHLQSWNERLASGAWGGRAAKHAENLRRSQDLDHWASFNRSFGQMIDLIRDVAAGRRGDPPSTVLLLSGDVHHGYLAEADLRDPNAKSGVYNAVCSPLRNALPGEKSFVQREAWSPTIACFTRLLARLSGAKPEAIGWRLAHDRPFFDNQVATLELENSSAGIVFERSVTGARGEPGLEEILSRRLA